MGWRASIGLADGIATTYREFAAKYDEKYGEKRVEIHAAMHGETHAAPAFAMAARA
jgi:GDP-L-fucose synthase